MKPALFIGSSREYLNIANACQQNLFKDAEVTVWNQGIFEISKSNLQSLIQSLPNFDFALFVFSPDDILRIRGEENKAVRDNVIFELGLFVGYLGRDRCFLLVPEGIDDFRIPTDIIEITPAEYEPNRKDGNLQAATGAACTSIRHSMSRLGPRSTDIDSANIQPKSLELTKEEQIIENETNTPQKSGVSSESDDEWKWLYDYIDKKYDASIILLEENISKATDESDLIYYESWLASAKYKSNPKIGKKSFKEVIAKYPNSYRPYVRFSDDLIERNLCPDALNILDSGLPKVENKVPLINAKAECLQAMGRKEEAVNLLRQAITQFKDNPDAYINLADYYIDSEKYIEARLCLEEGLLIIIGNKPLVEKYARLLYNHIEKKLALIPFNELIELEPANPTYLTLRANIYLELDLNDHALRDYKRANEITESKESWIIANIGNLHQNRGLYREAIENLQLALKLDPESQYAHNRLASSMKLRDEEVTELSKIIKEIKEQLLSSRFESDV